MIWQCAIAVRKQPAFVGTCHCCTDPWLRSPPPSRPTRRPPTPPSLSTWPSSPLTSHFHPSPISSGLLRPYKAVSRTNTRALADLSLLRTAPVTFGEGVCPLTRETGAGGGQITFGGGIWKDKRQLLSTFSAFFISIDQNLFKSISPVCLSQRMWCIWQMASLAASRCLEVQDWCAKWAWCLKAEENLGLSWIYFNVLSYFQREVVGRVLL